MFQEGDWNDSTDAQVLTTSLRVQSSSTPVSQRAGVSPGAGRKQTTKHLLETLRVLQSTSKGRKDHTSPVVKDTSGSDDGTAETAPVKSKRKKKRSKRRRQGQSSDACGSELQRVAEKRKSSGPEPSETPYKRKPAGDPTGNFPQDKGSEGAEHTTEDSDGKALSAAQLSRKQWKNKQKNKKRNKNKFKAGAETGGPPQQTKLEDAENPIARSSKAHTRETLGSLISNSRLKENCSSPQGPEFHKKAVLPFSSNTAVGKPARLKPPGSASDGHANASKLQVRKLAKLKKILEKRDKGALEVGGDGEGGTLVLAGDESTEAAGLEPTLAAPADRSAALRTKMEERLKSARFRYINQQLYTSSSKEAQGLFQQDPEAFDVYHRGFRTQVERWPKNPVDLIIKYIRNRPASLVVADFGCGDCKIARTVRNTVHSFDLAALNKHVTVCDMAKVPLPDESVDIAVFCLALMGTNLREFFDEANRVLKRGGILKVAEVASRFEDIRMFISALANMGFKNTAKDTENDFFYMFEFTKTGPPKSKGKLLGLELKACLYKKR